MLPRLAAAGAALLLTLGATLAATPAAASPGAASVVGDTSYFEFESMHVDFELGRDADGHSTLRAVETIVAIFPDFDQNRGIIRDIPTRERVEGFGQIDRGVTVESVTDENGDPVPFELSTWSDAAGTEFVSLALGTDEFVQGRTTYVITWTARDVVLPFADTAVDEFYWDVNGTGWGQPFGEVSTTVTVEGGLREALTGTAACYAGPAGSSTPCDAIEATEDGVRASAGELAPFENLSVAMAFDAGTFVAPEPIERSWIFTVLPWLALALIPLGLLAALVLRTAVWRHHPGRGIVIPEYEGPDDVGVMAAAEYLGRGAAALPAQLVRFATEGIARLVDDPDAPASRRYRLEIVDPDAAAGDDATALRQLFATTPKPGSTLVLDTADQSLGDRVASVVARGRARPAELHLRARAKSRLTALIRWPGLLALGGTLVVIGACFWFGVGSDLLTLQCVAGIVGSLVVLGFSGTPERRTQRGSELLEKLQGLRDYLQLAEADRLRILQSPTGAERTRVDPGDDAAVVRLYERLLPWAIVWGVEKEWSRVLDDRFARTPTAEAAVPTGMSYGALAATATSLRPASFATTPPPPSSSSSSGSGGGSFSGGSFGGGFSGGGGGGGGGGGR